jgi:formylglycine-generating enzyme required for sulfatase activity/pimeloyl-ACP methyl ester carboxylesterase
MIGKLLLGTFAGGLMFAQELVRIPEGVFEVADQITTVKSRISVGEILLGATEVTQEAYEAITGSNPSVYKGPKRPVENVSWWDVIRYCNLRSVKEGLAQCYDLVTGERDPSCTGYRLPTESEWVHAAGSRPAADQLSKLGILGDSSTKTMKVFEKALEKGTLPVASFRPNALGIFDMHGNVWEWCGDYFNVIASPDAVRNPSGPSTGLARVIRGGSFVSSTSRWSRDYRSSMNPDARARYTGFRVARTVEAKATEKPVSSEFFRRYNDAPKGFETSIGSLTALAAPGANLESWRQNEAKVRSKWETLLSIPKAPAAKPTARVIRDVVQRNFAGQIIELEMEPGVWEKIYVLRPSNAIRRPLPVMIVPFYDIDTPAAIDLGGRNYAPDRGVNAYAYTAAQHGYLAVAVRWFGESYGESYSEAVANLWLRHPGSTGLGKWIADARRTVDFIETLPDADAKRIGIIGHSLGGKMALYAAAFESRIRAVVSSELGIGFKFSNYDDYWYLGEKLNTAPAGTDQHELIALIAPRPFLLIGGDEYDKAESWHYINATRPIYELWSKRENVGYFNHHRGHTPTPEAISVAFEWLDHFLKP